MPPADSDLTADVRALVSRVIGRRHAITGMEPLHSRPDAAVLRVTLAGGRRLVVKVAGPHAEHQVAFERSAMLTALARKAGAPAPEVLGADDSRDHGRWRYLVAEHIAGTPWRDVRPHLTVEQVAAAHRQLAAALVATQSIAFGAFGELDRAGRPPAAQDLLTALLRRAELRIRDERARESFLQLLSREADLFVADVRATLVHDDLHHGNVLFRRDGTDWRLVALLDWDKAWAGPAESDVARMAFWDDMTGPGFWDVYRAHVPVRDGEDRRALVHQLLWCLEYDDASPRHAADTAHLRHRLAVP